MAEKLPDDELTMLVALRHDLHAHPELGFEETRTAEILAAKLEEAVEGMRRMEREPDYCRERLLFTKGLETTSPAER